MKRRLRRKKHIGEFQELGFKVGFRFEEDLGTAERNQLLDRFITHAVEANGLQFGGGGGANEWMGFAALDKRGSAMEKHRESVEEWMIRESLVRSYCIGPLTDAWHGDFSDPPSSSWKEK